MRSSANRHSYRTSEAGEQQRRLISGSGGSGTGTGTGTTTDGEETRLLASVPKDHHWTSSYQSTAVRRRSPRTTPSAGGNAMDGQQRQLSGGQGVAAEEDHANQYLAYSEQQQQPGRHQAQHMQHAEQQLQQQQQYSQDEYIRHPSPQQQRQQHNYDQSQQPQHHEVPQYGGPPASQNSTPHAQPPPPLMDEEAVNAEIMAVRSSALTVFSPLTYTWVSLTWRAA